MVWPLALTMFLNIFMSSLVMAVLKNQLLRPFWFLQSVHYLRFWGKHDPERLFVQKIDSFLTVPAKSKVFLSNIFGFQHLWCTRGPQGCWTHLFVLFLYLSKTYSAKTNSTNMQSLLVTNAQIQRDWKHSLSFPMHMQLFSQNCGADISTHFHNVFCRTFCSHNFRCFYKKWLSKWIK